MGVPKFFRWISERYPNTSRVISDNQIPDFDNFYLDMNGIIHACSHVNEDNCETNVTEEEIFRNIFHYIDFLFRMIKPKKVFYMAVDGVAPRAKMNQQRSRRFRAGRDRMKKLKGLAEKNGQTLKETLAHHFDTNAITPGTTFMTNLDEQLRYFINVKLTTDPLWEGVDIYLSGHLTPGEGEHKIMEYIRYTRSQPEYNINTRHCLYGLDADLIMLGLVTHEMHFALLREEVKYASKKVSKILAPEEINWHLLQLCLLRDYIDLEFRSIQDKLKFPYDLESIVDDWILMGYLVGNDFIPHLPHVHINQDALPLLWSTYKKVLPTLDGYMNESGELNLPRFETYLTELAKYDYERFDKENDSIKHLNRIDRSYSKPSELDKDQIPNSGFSAQILEKLMISTPINPLRDESAVKHDEDTNGQMIDKFIALERKSPLSSSSSSSSEAQPSAYPDADDDNDEDRPSSGSDHLGDTDDGKKKVSPTATTTKLTFDGNQSSRSKTTDEFRQHKNQYYHEKMKCESPSAGQIDLFVQQYIEALQWILKYYYQGCQSWSWFYPHHYAPYLSDLKNFKHLHFTFRNGTPFKPFEQLLGVLPPTSRYLLPVTLQALMVDAESPLLHFYPEDFLLDQNEKKQDWEAIVLLPFIEERLLLSSIEKYYPKLDADEKIRNQHMPSSRYRYTPTLQPITGNIGKNPHFPPLTQTHAMCTEFSTEFYRPDGLQFKHGRFDEKNKMNFPKFPVLNALPYTFEFKEGVVDLFDSRSKSTTLLLTLTHRPDADVITYNEKWQAKDEDRLQPFQITNRQGLIERYLGKRVFMNWPHFDYGIVCAISDFRQLHTWSNIPGGSSFSFRPSTNDDYQNQKNLNQTPIFVSRCPFETSDENNKPVNCKTFPLDATQIQAENAKAVNLKMRYENRQGVAIGPIPVLLYVCPLIGYRTKCSPSSDKCTISMCFSNQAVAYPLQTTVFSLSNYKYDLYSFPSTINEHFQTNAPIFALQAPNYSRMGRVQQITKDNQGKSLVECAMEASDVGTQPDIHSLANRLSRLQVNYWTAQQVAEYLQTMPSVVSKLTGTIIITTGTGRRENINRVNVGFSWKANKPLKQLYGYTKKEEQIWLYSDAAVLIISDYMLQFPEIIAELVKKPKEETYPEMNVWPTRKGKSRLQEVRAWIKNLPTYSMSLTDGAWQVLDAPVIKEIDRLTKSFYAKNSAKTPSEKFKSASFEANRLFKASESLGMCDPDIEARHELYDRVINVRLGAGVPIGTRGTIIGVMLGPTHLDTYYEVLFDHLPKNSLDAILFGGHNQQCRIKVRSYHLLNYSHSLRMRSMANYQQQKAAPTENAWEKPLAEPAAAVRQTQAQAPTRILKRDTTENATAPVAKPTPAPAAATQPKVNLAEMIFASAKKAAPSNNHSASVVTEKPVLTPVVAESAVKLPATRESAILTHSPVQKLPEFEMAMRAANVNLASPKTETREPLAPFPTKPLMDSIFLRAIQESKQIPSLEPYQSSNNTPTSTQQPWDLLSSTKMNDTLNDLPASLRQAWRAMPEDPVPFRQQPLDLLMSHHRVPETTPPAPTHDTLFARAIESMSHTPPSSMALPPFDPSSPNNMMSPSQPFQHYHSQQHQNHHQQHHHQHHHQQQQQQPMSILQRAILQSDQQFNANPAPTYSSNGFNSVAPFQPFDLLPQNTYPGFPIGMNMNQPSTPYHQPHASPVQLNNVRIGSPQILSSPQLPHPSPPSQTPSQAVTSPRMSGGSTLQFVPSQVLRNMPKSHK